MAKKENKKKQIPQIEHNKRSYFESGRVQKLPLGAMYMSQMEVEGREFIMFLITRDHINGNKAFSTFLLDPATGQLDSGLYDFNEHPDSIDAIVEEFDLEPFDDYATLHHTIYEAEENHRQEGYTRNPEFRFAMMIMESRKCPEPLPLAERPKHQRNPEDDTDDIAEANSLLGNWISSKSSARTSSNKTGEHFGKPLDFQDLSVEKKDVLLSYDRSEVADWTRAQWDQYFSETRGMDISVILLKGISPLLYIFEKSILPFSEAPDAVLSDAIHRFSRNAIELTNTPLNKIGNYSISEAETAIFTGYFVQVTRQSPNTNYAQLIRDILIAAKKYPQNPQFQNLIFICYQICNNKSAARKVAKTNFKQFPDYLFAKINYIDSLLDKQRYDRITEVLDSQFLLEDIYPDRSQFHYSEYKHFYRLLITYLLESNQFAAGWAFYEAFLKSPHYNSIHLKDIRTSLKYNLISLAKLALHWIDSIVPYGKMTVHLYRQLGV
ncbi:MAG TPA: hypothetical protein VL053_02025 [Arachidicoccus sp.]|nr:hypothetical protein [Arachidicoccus sp.]